MALTVSARAAKGATLLEQLRAVLDSLPEERRREALDALREVFAKVAEACRRE